MTKQQRTERQIKMALQHLANDNKESCIKLLSAGVRASMTNKEANQYQDVLNKLK
jgi:hypothetical protein